MPYAANTDLPSPVRNALPGHAQDIYRDAFNSSLDKHGSEERAAKTGWAAVKNAGYLRGPEGNWSRRNG